MVDTVSTRPVTRNKLAQFLKSQELIKVFENLTKDVGTVLPDVQALVQTLTALTVELGAEITEGPPPLPAQTVDVPDDVQSQLSALRDRLATLERTVAELREGPTP